MFKQLDNAEIATVGSCYPTASALVELAQPKALREEFVQQNELNIVYLRKSDAEVNWEARMASRSR